MASSQEAWAREQARFKRVMGKIPHNNNRKLYSLSNHVLIKSNGKDLYLSTRKPLITSDKGQGSPVSYGEGLIDPDYKKNPIKVIKKGSNLSDVHHVVTSSKKHDKSSSFQDVMKVNKVGKSEKTPDPSIGFRTNQSKSNNIHSKKPKIYRRPSVWA